jgi:hypothetical protein
VSMLLPRCRCTLLMHKQHLYLPLHHETCQYGDTTVLRAGRRQKQKYVEGFKRRNHGVSRQPSGAAAPGRTAPPPPSLRPLPKVTPSAACRAVRGGAAFCMQEFNELPCKAFRGSCRNNCP